MVRNTQGSISLQAPPSSVRNQLTIRQREFIGRYTDPQSGTFGNCYQSAIASGYSDKTARNLTHLNPQWLSEAIGQMTNEISPEQIREALTGVIYSDAEPTIIKLRAVELLMKHYNMFRQAHHTKAISVTVDLTGGSTEQEVDKPKMLPDLSQFSETPQA